eukprot:1592186-Amphidinium_carterae.1
MLNAKQMDSPSTVQGKPDFNSSGMRGVRGWELLAGGADLAPELGRLGGAFGGGAAVDDCRFWQRPKVELDLGLVKQRIDDRVHEEK